MVNTFQHNNDTVTTNTKKKTILNVGLFSRGTYTYTFNFWRR